MQLQDVKNDLISSFAADLKRLFLVYAALTSVFEAQDFINSIVYQNDLKDE